MARIWSIFALATLGQGDQAGELFAILNPDPPQQHARGGRALQGRAVRCLRRCLFGGAARRPRRLDLVHRFRAWLYRAGLEAILGFQLRGDHLWLDPCIPRAWPGFSIEYRHGSSRYLIEVSNPNRASCGIASVELDGVALDIGSLPDPAA